MKQPKQTIAITSDADVFANRSLEQWSEQARDDVSLSSTVSADVAPRKPMRMREVQQTTTTTTTTETKSEPSLTVEEPTALRRTCVVQFDESRNTYFEDELSQSLSEDECVENTWYSADEYAIFKKAIIRTVKTVTKHELKDPSPFAIGALLETTYQTCFECTKETRKNLLHEQVQAGMKNQYRQNEDYVLGLERLLVRRITKDRQELRRCLLQIILQLQSNKDQFASPEILAENISQVSLEATRSSRLFARHLGSIQVPYLLTQRPSIP